MYEEKIKTDKSTRGQRIKGRNKYTQEEGKEERKIGVNSEMERNVDGNKYTRKSK
jgi:hypothetical protein